MKNKHMPREQAYDLARREFYDLRMQEDIERRVATEEALAVGAQFGKSYMEIGLDLERKALEDWKNKASELLTLRRGRQAAFSGAAAEEEEATPAALEGGATEEDGTAAAAAAPVSDADADTATVP
jgi:small subunit ribosomal protein S23